MFFSTIFDMRYGLSGVNAPSVIRRNRSVSLKAFFQPKSHLPAEFVECVERSEVDGSIQTAWRPEWPDDATHATIRLFWGTHHIDSLTINRWAASSSISAAVAEYFDPGHTRLLKGLDYVDKKSSDPFEWAVVRLLNILGIPAIWYGNTVADRADAVAIIQSEKSTVILLIECTREMPIAKLSTLAGRAQHLRQYLQVKAEVLPVVFTQTPVVDSESTAAGEFGVGLLGANEIGDLVKLIAAPDTTTETVLQHLRPHQTIASRILGIAGGLTDAVGERNE